MNTVLSFEKENNIYNFTHRYNEFRIVIQDKNKEDLSLISYISDNQMKDIKEKGFVENENRNPIQFSKTANKTSFDFEKRKIVLYFNEILKELNFSKSEWKTITTYMFHGKEGPVDTCLKSIF